MALRASLFLALLTAFAALATPIDCSQGPPNSSMNVTLALQPNVVSAYNGLAYPDNPLPVVWIKNPGSSNPFLYARIWATSSRPSSLSFCCGYYGPLWAGTGSLQTINSVNFTVVGQCAGSNCLGGAMALWGFPSAQEPESFYPLELMLDSCPSFFQNGRCS